MNSLSIPRHRYVRNTLVSLIIMLILSGCFETIDGSGQLDTREIDMSQIRNVSVSATGTLRITYADHETLSISGDDNIVALMDIRRLDDSLVIEPHLPDVYIDPKLPMYYDLTVTSLESLTVSGEMSVEVHGIYNQGFNLASHGILDIYLQGQTHDMTLTQTGISTLDATALTVDSLDLDLTGKTDAAVSVSHQIRGSLAGLSSLTYFGGPVVDIDIKDLASADIGHM